MAPLPVQLSVYGIACARQRVIATQGVPGVPAIFADVDDGDARQGPRVMGLAASGGVKGGAVELHQPAAGVDRSHRGIEFSQISIS